MGVTTSPLILVPACLITGYALMEIIIHQRQQVRNKEKTGKSSMVGGIMAIASTYFFFFNSSFECVCVWQLVEIKSLTWK